MGESLPRSSVLVGMVRMERFFLCLGHFGGRWIKVKKTRYDGQLSYIYIYFHIIHRIIQITLDFGCYGAIILIFVCLCKERHKDMFFFQSFREFSRNFNFRRHTLLEGREMVRYN